MCEKETYHGDLFLNLNDEVKKTSKCKEIKEWLLKINSSVVTTFGDYNEK